MLLTVILLCIGTTAVHGKASQGCPEGSFFNDDWCYYFSRGKVSHLYAGIACDDDMNADLVGDYYEEEETNFLKSTLKGMNTTGAVGVWLDHYYDVSNGWDYDGYKNNDWADDPAPAGYGLCMFMSASKEWKWDAQDCYSEQDMISICRDNSGYKECYGSTCYLVFDDDKCDITGGYLAKIESEDENNFVKQFLREALNSDKVQIDGSDAGTEGTWVFADGEAMSFEDFDSDEPNNAGTGEDCIVMTRGRDFRWIDYTCDDRNNDYLCEYPMSGIVG